MLEKRLNDTVSMRLIEKRDAAALFAMVEAGRKDFEQWIPFVSKTKTLEDAVGYVTRFLGMYSDATGYVFGLWDGPVMIGTVMIKDMDHAAKVAEIGYMVARNYRGQGLAAKACADMIDFLFTKLGFQKVVLGCDERNEPSIAIAKRFGFELEGVLKRAITINGELCSSMQWALFRENYSPG